MDSTKGQGRREHVIRENLQTVWQFMTITASMHEKGTANSD